MPLRRVMVVGGPCAGKSTFARALGARTGLPVVHMDRIHWQLGWTERPLAEKLPMIRAEEAKPRWIIEGGLSATYAERAARADLVVFLDLPVGRRLWRMGRRIAAARLTGAERPDVPEDCPERPDLEFVRYTLRTAGLHRQRHLALIAGLPAGKGVVLRGDRVSARFVANVPRETV
ncbi:adenylate kinase family enzyme [Hasllibacter halocynthiae]|uniref:Adenylate kinase family enzyme n=1 Tax=Hasllibacter halocynthiae TaxID=595589 RepID=A0A2T0X2C5_9RHOB|nr:isopentenyl transferase family protein [Hasllibacter halocynthiae]PRY93045.1 adenylate kinase family enzyme [Hasllibacter halocynthiae]